MTKAKAKAAAAAAPAPETVNIPAEAVLDPAAAAADPAPEPELEEVNVATTGSFTNDFDVPADVWGSWTDRAKDVFNRLYWYMIQNQSIFKHPQAPVLEDEHWKTTAWNAAWIAANATDGR